MPRLCGFAVHALTPAIDVVLLDRPLRNILGSTRRPPPKSKCIGGQPYQPGGYLGAGNKLLLVVVCGDSHVLLLVVTAGLRWAVPQSNENGKKV